MGEIVLLPHFFTFLALPHFLNMWSTFLNKHPDTADDKCEERSRPMELVDDFGTLNDVDCAAAEV